MCCVIGWPKFPLGTNFMGETQRVHLKPSSDFDEILSDDKKLPSLKPQILLKVSKLKLMNSLHMTSKVCFAYVLLLAHITVGE